MKEAFLSTSIEPSSKNNKQFFAEKLYKTNWQQVLKITNIIFESESEFQKIIIFNNPIFGKVLALDNVLQTTQNDEFIYHEMLSHVPILSHGNVKKVLIIGGGDGGMLREVLRHKKIEKAIIVEIDEVVVEACKKYMPELPNGVYQDPRAEVIIGDGIEYVKNTNEKFDIIIIDSTDPIGPGSVLFTKEFYSYCKKSLNEDGIIVTQNGVPFAQGQELIDTYHNRSCFFKENHYFIAPVFGYIGGFMAFGWASDNKKYLKINEKTLIYKLKNIDGKMKYYNPQIHKASFVLPEYINNKLIENKPIINNIPK